MTLENIEKKIKKNIYGKPQTVKVIFPPGFGSVALDEVQFILENLWFQQKFTSELSLLDNEIRIDNIHLFAVTELLMRSQCISDIRLVIFEGKAAGKFTFEKKCREIPWDFYLNKSMSLKIKVDSVASHAFHETGLKEILAEVVADYAREIVSGENTRETTGLYANLYNDYLTVSISLAGNPLYKRGYRGTLSASAPLREDAAACCMQTALQFSRQVKEDFLPDTLVIPFSGTGTFAFEYLQYCFQFSPVLFGRDYALQSMPLFRPDNFNYLLKKAKENCYFPVDPADSSPHFYCIDHAANANTALADNLKIVKNAISHNGFDFPEALFAGGKADEPFIHEDFLAMDMATLLAGQDKMTGDVFIPLNPPYGVRLGNNQDSVALYNQIAAKLNEISSLIKKENKHMLGFILCPNVETWSAFCKSLSGAKIETCHFTQGGMDIRVCQFFV